VQTLNGYPLLSLFLFWTAARLLPFFSGNVALDTLAFVDNLFILFLIIAVVLPLLKVRQWRNILILATLPLLLASNVVFYLGALGRLSHGVHFGLYSGLYSILTLIFIMGRRILPFFIERGVGYPVKLMNWKWIDVSSLGIFLMFWITDLSRPTSTITAGLAGLLFFIHGIRLFGWHTTGIWKKPLLWILYLAYAFIVLGFALKTFAIVYGISPYLAVHAFAFGGIGMMTLGMMARVSLGHTGRDVHNPPRLVNVIFITLSCGALVRIIFPLFDNSLYTLWIAGSQILWIVAFATFLVSYFPILIYPRIDGRYG
ncbi:MAG: NnrS family protein, partial [Candidatus Binatia bacterium]